MIDDLLEGALELGLEVGLEQIRKFDEKRLKVKREEEELNKIEESRRTHREGLSNQRIYRETGEESSPILQETKKVNNSRACTQSKDYLMRKQLQQGVILSEILAPPLSKRRKSERMFSH